MIELVLSATTRSFSGFAVLGKPIITIACHTMIEIT